MKIKIFVLVMTLSMTLSTIILPSDIKVEANGQGISNNDPGLDHTYIYNKTKNLSDIIKIALYKWRSREHGEAGEQKAAERIENWMKNLSLWDVHTELLDENWEKSDNGNWGDLDPWIGKLDKKRQFSENDYYLNITVYNLLGIKIDNRCFSYDDCFPFLKSNFLGEHNEECKRVKVVKRWLPRYRGPQIVYIGKNKWSEPYIWNNCFFEPKYGLLGLKTVGFILGDNFSDTWFMQPSWKDHYLFRENFLKKLGGLGWLGAHIKPGFSITGDDADWLEGYLDNPFCLIYASVRSKWEYVEDIKSYNVIGQINGTDNESVSIVCAHYDCWWSQGTIDEAAETALVLGIAKYMKEKNLTLKHNVKFIAFPAEENGFRGPKDYIKEYKLNKENPAENLKYVINPGNFGHKDRFYYNEDDEKVYLTFEFASDNSLLSMLADSIADALAYEERTDIEISFHDAPRKEDSYVFYQTETAEGSISFGRSPHKMYHRGGRTTDVGDTMDCLDNSSFEIESEIVASVALHCTVDSEHRFVNTSITPYDSTGDGNNDSVKGYLNITTDTNTPLLSRVRLGFYDSNDTEIISIMSLDLYLLKKNNIKGDLLELSLPYDYPSDDYTVRLTVMDYWLDVDDEYNETVHLHPYSKPKSNFNTNITSLKTRSFTDNSTPSPDGTIVSWNWSFGDGNYSNQQNTSHTYYDDGNYTVSLTVCDSNNLSNISNMTIYVDNAIPTVSIDVLSNIQIAGDSISFNTSSSDSDGSITNHTWNFGDNTTDNSAGPSHTYSNSGLYTVNLTVTDDDGYTNYTTKTMIIAGALADDSYQQDDPQNHTWDTVQEAINDVIDDDIIFVYNGNYPESIIINRSISLIGQGKNQVTIQSLGTVIDIVNESVNLNGFTVKNGITAIQINDVNNCSIVNCDINDSINGIKITSGAENNTISKCNFTGNSYGLFISGSCNWIGPQSVDKLCNDSYFTQNRYGIYVDNAQDNMIVGCVIDATPKQPHPPLASYGVCLDEAVNNTIIYSRMHNAINNGNGIYMDDSTGNIICHNLIEFNDNGVFLTGSSDNRIAMNIIENNTMSGVTIIMMSSSGNTIHWNNFIMNGHGIFPQAYDDGSGNLWNTSGNETLQYVSAGEGNYWSDYNGSDNDGDGIGDTSYSITGIANAVDNYPVMIANDFKYS